MERGSHSAQLPGAFIALLPLMVVMAVNLLMSLVVLPRIDTGFLADAAMGSHFDRQRRRGLVRDRCAERRDRRPGTFSTAGV